MSLIIGVRCKDGCLVIADRRSHIQTGEISSYTDDFHKIVRYGRYLVYNHGYNRIGDRDWKPRHADLTPSSRNPIYAELLAEMANKPDKAAFYVFINGHEIHEIEVRVGSGVRQINHSRDDRIVSGTGVKYVTLGRLVNLQKSKCSVVSRRLRHTFEDAHRRMVAKSGTEFSREFDMEELLA
jgi:hypothetical protein